LAGNILSVALWVAATDFRTFLASRIVGGLSEANVQLANAIATDISDESQRSATMAMVGACFSIAFTFGPALGAALSNIEIVSTNPFATTAGFSFFLIVLETVYVYFCLPETHPNLVDLSPASKTVSGKLTENKTRDKPVTLTSPKHTNSPALLSFTHLVFLLPFSGMEFSLPFLTATLYTDSTINPAALNGRILAVVGIIASFLQGAVVRRLPPLLTVRIGAVSCVLSFFLLSRISSVSGLYVAACFLAVTSATVVNGLNSLISFEAGEHERGAVLGRHRSWGQVGRAAGPIIFCSLFWWVGREVAYTTGGLVMLGVCAITFTGLRSPSVENPRKTAK